MILIGIKSITTGTGYTEQDYSQVTHQQTDVLAIDFDKTPKVSSDRGSNSIYVDGDYMGKTCIETSAPIKIIDSKIIQYNVTPIY